MKKFFISVFLVVSLLSVSIVPAFAVTTEVAIGLAGLAISGGRWLYDAVTDYVDSSNASERAAAVSKMTQPWFSSISTAYGINVTAGDLYSVCLELNRSGFPCYIYHTSSDRYVIRGDGYLYMPDIGLPSRTYSISDLYFCSPNGSVYYSTTLPAETNLSAIRNYVDDIEGYIDQIEGRLVRNVNNAVYTVADSTYLSYQKLSSIDSKTSDLATSLDRIAGRLVKTVDGVTYTEAELTNNIWQELKTMTSSVDRIAGRLVKTAGGFTYTEAELTYNIWSRMNDLISAVNNQHITLDTSRIQVNVDSSAVVNSSNKAYCIGYRDDLSGNRYETLTIPYDTAAAIIAQLNTDYIDKPLTMIYREGGTATRYVRSASLLDDGYIRVKLTNGYSYYLCDNSNVLYVADMSGSLDYQVTHAVDTLGAKLDSINESVMAIDLNVEVIQNVQQYDDDVDNGVDTLSKILDLVREFFNPGAETNWRGAKDYAMNWGSDVE